MQQTCEKRSSPCEVDLCNRGVSLLLARLIHVRDGQVKPANKGSSVGLKKNKVKANVLIYLSVRSQEQDN